MYDFTIYLKLSNLIVCLHDFLCRYCFNLIYFLKYLLGIVTFCESINLLVF